uniref:Uncharacterized protein n=1 Tax=Anguilla anguilla TaxID=7936 RepID=A0A0E9UD88_ANGAN
MVWARPLSSSEGKSQCYSIQSHSRQFCAFPTAWRRAFPVSA